MRTVKDLIDDLLGDGGYEQAQRVVVHFNEGTSITIASENHPALDRAASEVSRVEPKQDAEGGTEV